MIRTPSLLFVIAISLVAIMVSVFALMVLKRVSESPNTVEAKLKLKPGETHTDFKILTVANTLLTITLIGYVVGGLLAFEELLEVMEIAMVFMTLPIAVVFYKIWRRMQ